MLASHMWQKCACSSSKQDLEGFEVSADSHWWRPTSTSPTAAQENCELNKHILLPARRFGDGLLSSKIAQICTCSWERSNWGQAKERW